MILFKKAMRSIWRGKRSYIACIVLMMIGIAVYTSFNLLFINLTAAENKMYGDQRFADAFAKVRGIPLNAAEALTSINGIEKADGRITVDARVTLPGKEEKIITLRIHSFDPGEHEPLNAFLITQGNPPGESEILVGDSFFKANSLDIGDTLSLIISGKQVRLTVSGAAQSPEYVYAIPDTGQIMPDNETFGFAYAGYGQLSTITGEQGLCDSLSFKLQDGFSFDDVKIPIEDALAPYGLIRAYARKDQPSASMLNQEINSLGSMATALPMVFILMAVIILYIMLKRVIEQERGSIGTLKAFGFSDTQILAHYLCYGLIVGGSGGLLGCIVGLWMSGGFTALYLDYFNLPALKASADPKFIAYGMLIALLSGAAGAFMGTRSMLKLTPSEAMRPPAPPIIKTDIFRRLPFLRVILAPNGFMAVRNITRSWFRSLFVILGIAFSFSMIGFTNSYTDMFNKMLIEQFSKVQMYDVKVSLKDPKPSTQAVEAVYGVGRVTAAEPSLELPAELRFANRKESLAITALEPDSRLRKIYDGEGKFYLQPPEGGLIISESLAKKVGAKRGDTLMMKTPYTGDTEIPMPVLGLVSESLGMTAYTELNSLCSLLGVPKSANCVLIATPDPGYVKASLGDADNVSFVTDKNESRKTNEDFLQTYSSMFIMMQLAGMGVAFAIITNTSSISLSERKREYATLRVLGMHPREIGKILGFEYWLLTFVGIIPGIPLLRALKAGMSGMMDTTLFTIPLSTPVSSYIAAAALCMVTVEACNFLSARRIAKFDMVEVLKERE